MNPKITHLKRATVVTVAAALVLCQSYVTGTPLAQVVTKLRNYVVGTNNAMPHADVVKLPNVAQLSSSGAVTLNGMNAPNGATVFSGSGVKTTETSTATLSLGTTAQVALAQASDFTLAMDGKTLGGELRAGQATIMAPAGVAVKIATADGPVETDGREATTLAVDVTSGKTLVTSRTVTNAYVESQGNESQDIRSRTVSLSPQEALAEAKNQLAKAQKTQKTIANMQLQARQDKDVLKLNCVNDKLVQLKPLVRTIEDGVDNLKNNVDMEALKQLQNQISEASNRINSLLSEAQLCTGEGESNFGENLTITTIIVSVFVTAGELLNNPPGEPDSAQTLSPIQPF